MPMIFEYAIAYTHTHVNTYIHTSWLCPRQTHRNLVHIIFIINVYYVGRKNISEEVEWGV